MKRIDDHPLAMSNTGSFGPAARQGLQPPIRSKQRRLARLARLWPLVAILLLALGPIAAWFAYRMADDAHTSHVRTRFEDALAQRTAAISEQVLSFAEVLQSCQGLYDASEHVNHSEFATFNRQARGRHPCIEAIAWAPRTELRGQAIYQIQFVEPRARRAQLVHLDLNNNEELGSALERALRDGRPMLAAPLRGVGGETQSGAYGAFILGVSATDPQADPAEPLGVVILTFRYDDLISPRGSEDTAGLMRLMLFDITPGDSVQLAAIHGERTDIAAGIDAQQRLEIAGRTWRLSALPTRRFLALHDSQKAIGIAAVVFLLWELFAGLLLALSHASRSNAVRRQGRNVARVMQSLGEGVVVARSEGCVRLTNAAARELIGSVVNEADAETFERAVRFVRADDKKPFGPKDAPLRRAMRGETFDQEACFVYTPARPEGVFVSVSGSPLRDEWGRALGGVLAIRDDTERRRTEQSLRDKDARLRARELEMELAARVQKRFYPSAPPSLKGIDLAGAVRPADETCGDYYDFLDLSDGSLMLAIGDVSGHGLGPALVMAETRAYVRSLARAGCNPREILERCNAQLCRDLADDLFVTMLLIRIDARGRQISFASAGHTPALLVSPDGTLKQQLEKSGPPLGILENRRYRLTKGVAFDQDDVLVLMTDGVTEATSGEDEYFEEEGVYRVVRKHRQRHAGEILREIGQELDRFAGERSRRDDVTLVVCKRTAAVPSPKRSLSSTWSDA